jgi:photoactive yellow protein
MLELSAADTLPPFDPEGIDDRSDGELDALSFGVIALDEEGTILRYNLYESRFARLDRNQVVGRNFFSEIARCTRTPEFEGRFRAFAADPAGARVERFQFVFDFKFGAQDVSIELVRVPEVARFYLLVNRTRVRAPRADFPPALLAARQSDLAPDEPGKGVLRDELERRYVRAPMPFFAALRATCDRLAPDSWQIFSQDWGVQWGRRAAIDLEAASLERSGASLRELPMRRVADLLSSYFQECGFGAPRFDFEPASEGLVLVTLERSALAEAAPRSASVDGTPYGCHLVAGCIGAVLSSLAERKLAAREIACVSQGTPACTLAIVGHARRGALDAAIAAGAPDVERVRRALRNAASARETA